MTLGLRGKGRLGTIVRIALAPTTYASNLPATNTRYILKNGLQHKQASPTSTGYLRDHNSLLDSSIAVRFWQESTKLVVKGGK
ncbi:hypothetical protein EDB19DRAFT_1813017 [Suillus lakei]|nr:hypothetical protein EDB19DRAFT_1813017 [Suillus lakei]